MKRNFKNIMYSLGIVWKADRFGFIAIILDILWNTIPVTAQTLIYKFLISAIMNHASIWHILSIVAVYGAINIINRAFVSSFVYNYLLVRTENKVEEYCNIMLLKKSCEIDMSCYDNKAFYDELSMALAQINDASMEVFYQCKRLISNILNIVIGFSIILTLDPLMLAVALVSGVIFYLLDISFLKARNEHNDTMAKVSRYVDYYKSLFFKKQTAEDMTQFSGMYTLLIDRYKSAFKSKQDAELRFKLKALKRSISVQGLSSIITVMFPYIHMAIQCYREIITVADISAEYSSYQLVVDSFSELSREISNLKQSSHRIDNIINVIDYKAQIESSKGIILDKIHSITFENVSFRYSDEGEYVIRNINLNIKENDKLALVGLNGAGKNTLIKLILRYYDPTEGAIYINEKNLREYDIKSVRLKMTTLLQDYQTYCLKISELVSCDTNPNTEKVESVIASVGLNDMIRNTEEQYGREFDENGIVLSGGGQQKLFIARMCYKGGDLYIMDEPNSALDPLAEAELYELMSRMTADKTLIMISHRLMSCKMCDRIIVMENGAILQQGTQDELMNMDGLYQKMWTAQSKQYLTDPS